MDNYLQDLMKPESYLHFKILFEDSHLIEIEVSTSNGKYCGATSTYIEADGEQLINLGKMLLSFSENTEHKVIYEFGADSEYLKSVNEMKKQYPGIRAHLSYVALDFHRTDVIGHSTVEITLHENTHEESGEGVEAKVYLKLPFEFTSLIEFARSLITMGNAKNGEALLAGIRE